MFINQWKSAMTLLLLAAGIIAFSIGDALESAAIETGMTVIQTRKDIFR